MIAMRLVLCNANANPQLYDVITGFPALNTKQIVQVDGQVNKRVKGGLHMSGMPAR